MTEEVVRRRDPILDPPRKKGFLGLPAHMLALIAAVIVGAHALVIYAVYKQRFELELRQYSDDVVDVEIIDPIPPPPKLQVREAVIPPNAPAAPAPLVVQTTDKEDRQEYQGPPQITQSPPPPPAPPAPPRPPVISRVDWARQPSVEFPERAQARGIESGSVSLTCVVGSDGTPRDCSITSEDPAGAGFGQAALSAMRRARFSPRTVDGVAEGGRANFTIRFRLE
ncbi:MAG TPA: energy transducer TonB [Brevundimonas sp.]|uniref:energy transducer TonB n=1 Tax=Brevundimonas sp. TaxID=1871086 RepID=UPI002B75340B|nr:energy transducer TonB [Brevundimonas sp.]HRH20558.1 energy transducer TonB [Brevundimonas sp.]